MKLEMHTHTSESSPCAKISASRMTTLYRNAGYDGIVITDHYSKWVMDSSGQKEKNSYIDSFLSGYHHAVQSARNTSLQIFLGAEVSLTESPNDYLLYCASEAFFHEQPLLFEYSLQELYTVCQDNGILLFQAHPNRSYCTPSNPEFLDGAEIYNGNPRHNNYNNKSKTWAREHQLIPCSGSDFHEEEDLARGGIQTDYPVNNWIMLKQVLQTGDYALISK